MTTGAHLKALLAQVASPTDDGFSVIPATEHGEYRIGRAVGGALVLLTPADPDPDPPTNLRRLSLDPSVRCTITTPEMALEVGTFGVAQLRVEDEDFVEPFLDVVAALIRLLGPTPGPGEVSAAMRRLVRLFDPLLAVRGSVLGLWAELLALDICSDVRDLADAWHAHADDAFDFAAPGSRLEVKATTRSSRIHQFAWRQLRPVPDTTVTVLSVMTTETSNGTSVGDLVRRLEAKLAGDPPRQMRLHEQVSAVLGPDWAGHLAHRFDEQQARAGLALFPADQVPSVVADGPEVLDVRITVDCSQVPPVQRPEGLASLLGPVTGSAGRGTVTEDLGGA